MLGINGKQWNDIQWTDVEEFLNERMKYQEQN